MNEQGINCCGAARKSRFCPDCGRILRQHNLHTLLAYCRQHVSSCQTTVRARDAKDPDDRRARQAHSTANKWQSWVDSLEGILVIEDVAEPEAIEA